MGKLDGKVALVTGASRGIGQAIAELFAAEGARVVCTARTLEEGGHPLFEGSLERTVEQARATFGPLDVLVNNAALTYFIPIAQFPVNKWLRSFAVNVHGPFYMSQLALEHMLPRRRGAIVNISSGAAIGPGRAPYTNDARRGRGGTLYGAEKAALERFTQGLAAEVWDEGISVTCVSPSQVVATPGVLHHRLVRDANDPNAEPQELMARAALLLASEPLDKVSGRVTYSQQILKEFGSLDNARGLGVDVPGSGYSQS